MSSSPKSSQSNACNFLLAALALWSWVSLVVIIVWAAWPSMRDRSHSLCQAAKQTASEELNGAEALWGRDQALLKEQLRSSRAAQESLGSELKTVAERVGEDKAALEKSVQWKEIMRDQINALKIALETHMALQKNLSSIEASQKGHAHLLRANLTWNVHYWESCSAFISAANNNQMAAESKNKACDSANEYLTKRLNACRNKVNDV